MQVLERDNAVVVSVQGDQCSALWKTMEPYVAAGKKRYVLDLAQITFLNSVAIAAIISARNKIAGAGAKVALANLGEGIKAVFRILKLERLFNLDLTVDAAVAALA